MFKNMNWNKGDKGNKRHLFRKLGIYDKIGKKGQHKIVAFQSQWRSSFRFTFYFKAGSLHLKRHFARVPGSGHKALEWCVVFIRRVPRYFTYDNCIRNQSEDALPWIPNSVKAVRKHNPVKVVFVDNSHKATLPLCIIHIHSRNISWKRLYKTIQSDTGPSWLSTSRTLFLHIT